MIRKTAFTPLVVGLLLLHVAAAVAAEASRSLSWSGLDLAQKQALAPLQRDWAALDEQRKQKWLEVAARFPSMPEDERGRVRERMTEWARLTPSERTRARLQFQEAQQLPAAERQARWQAYQSLSLEERNKLAQRAKPVGKAVAPSDSAPRTATAPAAVAGKRNLVQSPSLPPSRAVSPTIVQAKPGATTTSMSTKVAPPVHHQAGLPKIAATPGFVDPATLLPKRGPQGAAVRSAAASSSATQP